MSRYIVHDGRGALRVRFPFDRRLVELVKTIPSRRWNPEDKYWWVPEQEVVAVVDLLGPEGFQLDQTTRELYLSSGGTRAAAGTGSADRGPALPGLFEDRPPRGIDEAPGDPSPPAAAAAVADFTVSGLNQAVKRVLAAAFPTPVWLVGEISGFNKSAHRRIVGFHLVERDEQGTSIAEVNAVVFEETRREIEARLAAAGGPFRLEDEVTVRMRGSIELYEPWGQYRFRVQELDLAFTLGEAARRREEIVRRLTAEGLTELNTSLALSELPLRLGLITSLGSDAFNDVLRTLQESGYAFRVVAHGARVQGRSTEPSVLNALDWFRERTAEFDAVLICRGGGSRTDLAWFDSEALGRAVATFPIPVVIGIGHEQDQSVLDFVGWRCKTPTAAAAFLVERVRDSAERIEALGRAVADAAARTLEGEGQAHADRSRRLARAARAMLDRERAEVVHRRLRAVRGARALLASALHDLERRASGIPRAAILHVERRRAVLDQSARQLVLGARRDLATSARRISESVRALGPRGLRHLALETERAEARARRLHLVDPRRVVERGYAILRAAGGGVVSDARDAPADTPLRAELRRGRLRLRSEGAEPEGGG